MGDTYPEEIGKARYLVGDDVMMLIPGIGTQRGDLEKSVRGAMNSRGNGFLINVSSGISKAKGANGRPTKKAFREAALKFHNEIKDVWQDAKSNPQPTYFERMFLAFDMEMGEALLGAECLKFGEFVLKSGKLSPVYMDLRSSITDPDVRHGMTGIYVDMVKRQEQARGREFDLIAGNPQAGTAFGTPVADRMHKRLVQPRAGGAKNHVVGKTVERRYSEGESVVLIEDLVTTAKSIFETAPQLTESGLVLAGVVAAIDRKQGGTDRSKFFNIPFTAASTLRRIIVALGNSGRISEEQYHKTINYLDKEATEKAALASLGLRQGATLIK
jgi:uridine monophosphate synthetase